TPDRRSCSRCQQIQQVVMNLLTNARDALNEKYPDYHEDKIIHVAARQFEKDGKSWIRVTVEDHGHGIPREIRTRLFDPFFTTKLGKGGTGLGLAISHGIAKDHNGELHFETETGCYTRFHLDLPVSEEKRS
ncbi:MAG: ATP-binding protein, partial [Verrucomicrobiia bacterium]